MPQFGPPAAPAGPATYKYPVGNPPPAKTVDHSIMRNLTFASLEPPLASARSRGSRPPGAELGFCGSCNVTATSHLRDRLPVLATPGASPAWDRYLEHVYGGPLPRSAYPVDLRQFSWFYFDHLPLRVAPAWMAATCESAYGHAWTGWPGCGSGGHGLPESQPALRAAGFFVQQHDPTGSRPPQTLANGSWVEVMRTAMNRSSIETPGSWYWLARGSGVWLNVRSIYTDIPPRGEAYWFFRSGGRGVRDLLRRGFNTLLFPRLAGTRTYTGVPVNNDRVEIIALHSTPGMRGTCSEEFMTGWNHGSVCTCKESLGVVNCRGAPPPPAKTGDHSIMRNLTFASLEPPLAPDEPLAAYLERLYHEALDERNKYIHELETTLNGLSIKETTTKETTTKAVSRIRSY